MLRPPLSLVRLLALLVAVPALASGCPVAAPATDGGTDAPAPDAPSTECTVAADCDDGLFCTGTEACTAGRCVTTPVDCDDGVACTRDRCSEERLRCVNEAPDVDGDGYGDAACLDGAGDPLGNDCADDDAMRYPGNREVCDASHDEDCDDTTLGAIDDDSDGFVSIVCCNGMSCGDDCDDARDGTYPGATEVCDGLDQNCDGTADDGVALAGFVDADRDGWGDSTMPRMACADSAGWVPMDRGGDCADDLMANANARAINPGQPEICDGIRNDCSTTLAADDGAGAVNWYGDSDGDGFGAAATSVTVSCAPVANASLLGTDCDDTAAARNPAAAEACNARDDDCNGSADFRIAANDFEDDDGDGLIDLACTPLGTDCNDRDASSGPGELERCDGRDNDCDAIVDEGATSLVYYRDVDADGFGSASSGSIVACMPSAGYVVRGGDCNDSDATRFPGATERCNAADEDCDAAVDETPASSDCTTLPGVATSVCVSGRCTVAECAAGREDCNARDSDGCEVTLSTDDRNCGACGRLCASGESCVGGNCDCDATAVSCPGGCIDPRLDERFCGAEGSCNGFSAGTACRPGENCMVGLCLRSQVFPGAVGAVTRARATTYTIDGPGAASIEYTTDGSVPGSSATTMTAAAPVQVTLDGGGAPVRLRWRARYATGEVEGLQSFTHTTDARSTPSTVFCMTDPECAAPLIYCDVMNTRCVSPLPIDNTGVIAERVDIAGSGPVAVVAPGASVSFTLDLQHWHDNGSGYCPGCAVYTSVNFEFAVVSCVGVTSTAYPGVTAPGVTGTFTAPMFGGIYPLTVRLAQDFSCQPSGGEPVGWVIVDGPGAAG